MGRKCCAPVIINAGGADESPGSELVEVGCGLTGSGIDIDPIAVNTAPPGEAWPWSNCTAEEASTLKCDPNTGELWSPPEHYFNTSYSNYSTVANETYTAPTSGCEDIPGASGSTLINNNTCRAVSFFFIFTSDADVSWETGAEFQIGMNIYEDGTLDRFEPIGGVGANQPGGRLTFQGSNYKVFHMLPSDPNKSISLRPAICVISASLTESVTVNTHRVARGNINGTVGTAF